MRAFEPDVIIALGGGSAMDAGKIMWVMYEHPEADFDGYGNAISWISVREYIHSRRWERKLTS